MKLSAQITLFSSVKRVDILLFTKHLAVMLKAGIPVPEALQTLAEQAKSSTFKKILTQVLKDVENGKSLADALNKHPKAFDHFYVSLVEVSENSGTLEENLEFMAEQLNKDYNLKQKIRGAMLYPSMVVVSAIIMSGFIAFFVLPQLVDFFEALDIELPITTRILLFVANITKNFGLAILTGIVASALGFGGLIQVPSIKPYWHAFLLKLPLIGKMIAYGQLARLSRNLGVLLKSGVPVTKSLTVTADTLSNEVFKTHIKSVGSSLKKGKSIGAALQAKHYSEFPPLVSRMISVGEKTGKLDETLLYLGDFFEEEIDTVSKNITTVLEPALLLVIGLIVGFVALAIITPIYQLTSSVRR